MNVVTGTGAEVLTIATGTTSAHHPPRLSRTTREPSDVYREGLKRCAQVPSVCRATSPRPSSGLTFARRRHSQSLDSPYLSRPRMKRRGAVSYDKNDAAAEYIRYLGRCGVVRISDRWFADFIQLITLYTGDTLNQQRHVQTCTPLAELPANKCKRVTFLQVNVYVCRSSGQGCVYLYIILAGLYSGMPNTYTVVLCYVLWCAWYEMWQRLCVAPCTVYIHTRKWSFPLSSESILVTLRFVLHVVSLFSLEYNGPWGVPVHILINFLRILCTLHKAPGDITTYFAFTLHVVGVSPPPSLKHISYVCTYECRCVQAYAMLL